jgi:hypothetical protein
LRLDRQQAERRGHQWTVHARLVHCPSEPIPSAAFSASP